MATKIESRERDELRTERAKPPTFDGNVRNYASFKKDFTKIVEKRIKDVADRTYILKTQCLKSEARSLVQNLDDIEEIWERLNSKYGDKNRIVRLVLQDIKELTFNNKDVETHNKSYRYG